MKLEEIGGKHVKSIVWTDEYLDLDDWDADIKAEYPDMGESDRFAYMHELNAAYLDDERVNLNVDVGTPIVALATLGLWNGTRLAAKEISSGNIADCLRSSAESNTWFVDDRNDLWCEAVHHDGRNYYLYRAWKPGITQTQKENFINKFFAGNATRKDINRYTSRVGDHVCRVYGVK